MELEFYFYRPFHDYDSVSLLDEDHDFRAEAGAEVGVIGEQAKLTDFL